VYPPPIALRDCHRCRRCVYDVKNWIVSRLCAVPDGSVIGSRETRTLTSSREDGRFRERASRPVKPKGASVGHCRSLLPPLAREVAPQSIRRSPEPFTRSGLHRPVVSRTGPHEGCFRWTPYDDAAVKGRSGGLSASDRLSGRSVSERGRSRYWSLRLTPWRPPRVPRSFPQDRNHPIPWARRSDANRRSLPRWLRSNQRRVSSRAHSRSLR
jgi:hypothetical protein